MTSNSNNSITTTTTTAALPRYWYRTSSDCGGLIDCIRGDFTTVADLRDAIFRRLVDTFPDGATSMCVALVDGQVLDPMEATLAAVPATYTANPTTLGAKQLLVSRVAPGRLGGLIFTRVALAGPHAPPSLTTARLAAAVESANALSPGGAPRRRPWSAGATPPREAFVRSAAPPPPKPPRVVLEVYLETTTTDVSSSRRNVASSRTSAHGDSAASPFLLSTTSLGEQPADAARALEAVRSHACEAAATALQIPAASVEIVRLLHHDTRFDDMVLLVSGEPLVAQQHVGGAWQSRTAPSLCRVRAYVRPQASARSPTRERRSATGGPLLDADDISELHTSESDVDSTEPLLDDGDSPAPPAPVVIDAPIPREPAPPSVVRDRSGTSRPPPIAAKAPSPRATTSNNGAVVAVPTPSATMRLPCSECPLKAAELARLMDELRHTRQVMLTDLDAALRDLGNLRLANEQLDRQVERATADAVEERRRGLALQEELTLLQRDSAKLQDRARAEGAAEGLAAAQRWKDACDEYRREADRATREASQATAKAEAMMDELASENADLTERLLQDRRGAANTERRLDEVLAELRDARMEAVASTQKHEVELKQAQEDLKRMKKKAIAMKHRAEEAETRLATAEQDRHDAMRVIAETCDERVAAAHDEAREMRERYLAVAESLNLLQHEHADFAAASDQRRSSHCASAAVDMVVAECDARVALLVDALVDSASALGAFACAPPIGTLVPSSRPTTNNQATQSVVIDAWQQAKAGIAVLEASEASQRLQLELECLAAVAVGSWDFYHQLAAAITAKVVTAQALPAPSGATNKDAAEVTPQRSLSKAHGDASFFLAASGLRHQALLATLQDAQMDADDVASEFELSRNTTAARGVEEVPPDVPAPTEHSPEKRRAAAATTAGPLSEPPPQIVLISASTAASGVEPLARHGTGLPQPDDVVAVSDIEESTSDDHDEDPSIEVVLNGTRRPPPVAGQHGALKLPQAEDTLDSSSRFDVDASASGQPRRAEPAMKVPTLPVPTWAEAMAAANAVIASHQQQPQKSASAAAAGNTLLVETPAARNAAPDMVDDEDADDDSFDSLEDDLHEYAPLQTQQNAASAAGGGEPSGAGGARVDKHQADAVEREEAASRRALVGAEAADWRAVIEAPALAMRIVTQSYRVAAMAAVSECVVAYDAMSLEQVSQWKGLLKAFDELRPRMTTAVSMTDAAAPVRRPVPEVVVEAVAARYASKAFDDGLREYASRHHGEWTSPLVAVQPS